MAQKGIREFNAKRMLAKFLPEFTESLNYSGKVALVDPNTNFEELAKDNPWLNLTKLVVKPDQLFGKRGKNNLLLLDATLPEAVNWIKERMNQEITVGKSTGILTHFLIEPFVPHEKEYYVAIKSNREGEEIFFSTNGGINVEENWDNVKSILIPAMNVPELDDLTKIVPPDMGEERIILINFLNGLFHFYRKLGFSYLEINPFTLIGREVVPLDTVGKVDDTAFFECAEYWGDLKFPKAFGSTSTPEEKMIEEMDEKTGASLKLTILNPEGKIWLMVAGGGASVVYTDTVADLGKVDELANYGEYSGNPSKDETYVYASTILDLMTRKLDPSGKCLLIGGGIANFTDVAKTFEGIIKALREYKDKLVKNKIKIFVRRGGPNYKEGLENMKKLGEELNLDLEVYGPETHMTKIVSMGINSINLGGIL